MRHRWYPLATYSLSTTTVVFFLHQPGQAASKTTILSRSPEEVTTIISSPAETETMVAVFNHYPEMPTLAVSQPVFAKTASADQACSPPACNLNHRPDSRMLSIPEASSDRSRAELEFQGSSSNTSKHNALMADQPTDGGFQRDQSFPTNVMPASESSTSRDQSDSAIYSPSDSRHTVTQTNAPPLLMGPATSNHYDSPYDSIDALTADPNYLSLPTRPEEVEILEIQTLTLEEAIFLSLQNSENLQIALLELEQSRDFLREEEAALYPRIGLNLGLSMVESNSITSVPTVGGLRQIVLPGKVSSNLSGSIEMIYDLFTSGRRKAAIGIAYSQVRFNELAVEQQQKQLQLEVAQDYFNLQGATERARISELFLVEAERNFNDALLRYEAGIGTQFDVIRADIQVANAQQSLTQAQSRIDIATAQLSRRLNLPANVNITATPITVSETWSLSLEESIILAYQNRVELEQQLVDRSISEQRQQVSRASTLPRISLFAGYDFEDELNRSPVPTDTIRGGIRLNWDFYDGGAASAQSRQRAKDREIAEARFSDTRNNVRQEVESSYFSLRASLDNLRTASLAVEQANKALDIAVARFNSGIGTQLDLLSSTRELTDSQVSLVTAMEDYNKALAELQRAVGLSIEISL